jgi:hypothetical protein
MISMLPHRTAGACAPSCNHGPPWSERVRGLGVCDALQLRVQPAQVALAWAETLADVRELEWFTFDEG